MRSSRALNKRNKKQNKKILLWIFLFGIPAAAVITALMIHIVIFWEQDMTNASRILITEPKDIITYKYNVDINAKKLYRVEIKKFVSYEEADAQITALRDKKLNGYIVKDLDYIVVFGIFADEAEAQKAVKYLNKKHTESIVGVMNLEGFHIKYNRDDKNLAELASAIDRLAIKVIRDKSMLSSKHISNTKTIGEDALVEIIKDEQQLLKYLNFVKSLKTTNANAGLRASLEDFVKELLVDKLEEDSSYDYYEIQNSLRNQIEAFQKFYSKQKMVTVIYKGDTI